MTRRSERHSFNNKDGLKLAAIIEHSESPAKGVILMSHCFTCSKDLKTIVRLCRQLADLGWTNARFDFQGIGQSEGNFSHSNFATNLNDLISAIDWLRTLDLTTNYLFGHSFGGAASLAVLGRLNHVEREKLCGVITLAAPSDTSHLADTLLGMNPSIASGAGNVQIGGKEFLITTQMIEDFRAIPFREFVLEGNQYSEIAHLLIHSLADGTVAYANATALYDLLSGTSDSNGTSNVTLYTMPDADHLLANNPRDIEIVAGLINGWCEQQIRRI